MPLNFASRLLKEEERWYENATSLYLRILKKYLSQPYELPGGTVVKGKITEIKGIAELLSEKELEAMKEIIGKEVEFILGVAFLGSYDYLFIAKSSWSILRDYGIIPEEFVIEVTLTEIELNGEIVEIYPKRDIRLGLI